MNDPVSATSLTIKHDDGTEETVEFEFDEAEWVLLRDFLEAANAIEQTEMVKSGREITWTFRFDPEKGASTEATMPPYSEVAELLHRLRPLILQSEPASFVTVVALLKRRLDNAAIRAKLGKGRRLFMTETASTRRKP